MKICTVLLDGFCDAHGRSSLLTTYVQYHKIALKGKGLIRAILIIRLFISILVDGTDAGGDFYNATFGCFYVRFALEGMVRKVRRLKFEMPQAEQD